MKRYTFHLYESVEFTKIPSFTLTGEELAQLLNVDESKIESLLNKESLVKNSFIRKALFDEYQDDIDTLEDFEQDEILENGIVGVLVEDTELNSTVDISWNHFPKEIGLPTGTLSVEEDGETSFLISSSKIVNKIKEKMDKDTIYTVEVVEYYQGEESELDEIGDLSLPLSLEYADDNQLRSLIESAIKYADCKEYQCEIKVILTGEDDGDSIKFEYTSYVSASVY